MPNESLQIREALAAKFGKMLTFYTGDRQELVDRIAQLLIEHFGYDGDPRFQPLAVSMPEYFDDVASRIVELVQAPSAERSCRTHQSR